MKKLMILSLSAFCFSITLNICAMEAPAPSAQPPTTNEVKASGAATTVSNASSQQPEGENKEAKEEDHAVNQELLAHAVNEALHDNAFNAATISTLAKKNQPGIFGKISNYLSRSKITIGGNKFSRETLFAFFSTNIEAFYLANDEFVNMEELTEAAYTAAIKAFPEFITNLQRLMAQ